MAHIFTSYLYTQQNRKTEAQQNVVQVVLCQLYNVDLSTYFHDISPKQSISCSSQDCGSEVEDSVVYKTTMQYSVVDIDRLVQLQQSKPQLLILLGGLVKVYDFQQPGYALRREVATSSSIIYLGNCIF